MKLRILTTAVLILAGCKAIPLNDDPTVPRKQAHVSLPALYEVAWYTPLVELGLLEYQPSEPASAVVDTETDLIYVTTRDGFVRCLSPVDGSVQWSFKTEGRFLSGPAVRTFPPAEDEARRRSIVYVAGGDGQLYALKAESGELAWAFKANEELVTTPTFAGDKILVASQSETLFAVDIHTGAWVWQYRRDPPSGFTVRGTSQPVVRGDLIYMGFADGHLVALNLQSGISVWEKRLAISGGNQFLDVDSTPVLSEGRVYAASYLDGIQALDEKTGDLIWSAAHPGLTGILSRGNTLFATGDGSLTAFDKEGGRRLWSVNLSDRTPKGKGVNVGRSLAQTRNYVLVPTSTALALVDPNSGKVHAMWNPGRGVTAAPTPSRSHRFGSRLYVVSNLGTVFALQLLNPGG